MPKKVKTLDEQIHEYEIKKQWRDEALKVLLSRNDDTKKYGDFLEYINDITGVQRSTYYYYIQSDEFLRDLEVNINPETGAEEVDFPQPRHWKTFEKLNYIYQTDHYNIMSAVDHLENQLNAAQLDLREFLDKYAILPAELLPIIDQLNIEWWRHQNFTQDNLSKTNKMLQDLEALADNIELRELEPEEVDESSDKITDPSDPFYESGIYDSYEANGQATEEDQEKPKTSREMLRACIKEYKRSINEAIILPLQQNFSRLSQEGDQETLDDRKNHINDFLKDLKRLRPSHHSEEWDAMEQALYRVWDICNSDNRTYLMGLSRDDKARELASCVELLRRTAHNYSIHKVNQGKSFDHGTVNFERLEMARKIEHYVSFDVRGLNRMVKERNLTNYFTPEMDDRQKLDLVIQQHANLEKLRRSFERGEEASKNYVSREYKQMTDAIDEFLKDGSIFQPVSELKTGKAVFTEEMNAAYWKHVDKVLLLTEKYLEHKQRHNDGKRGGIERMQTALAMRKYLGDLKNAEEERLQKLREAEEEKIRAQKAEEERLAQQKAEEERLAHQKAEEERLAQQQKEEEERLAQQQKAEEERIAAQQAEELKKNEEQQKKPEEEQPKPAENQGKIVEEQPKAEENQEKSEENQEKPVEGQPKSAENQEKPVAEQPKPEAPAFDVNALKQYADNSRAYLRPYFNPNGQSITEDTFKAISADSMSMLLQHLYLIFVYDSYMAAKAIVAENPQTENNKDVHALLNLVEGKNSLSEINARMQSNTNPIAKLYADNKMTLDLVQTLINPEKGLEYAKKGLSNRIMMEKKPQADNSIPVQPPKSEPTAENQPPKSEPTAENQPPKSGPTAENQPPKSGPTVANQGPKPKPTAENQPPKPESTVANQGPKPEPTVANQPPKSGPTVAKQQPKPKPQPTVAKLQPQPQPQPVMANQQPQPTVVNQPDPEKTKLEDAQKRMKEKFKGGFFWTPDDEAVAKMETYKSGIYTDYIGQTYTRTALYSNKSRLPKEILVTGNVDLITAYLNKKPKLTQTDEKHLRNRIDVMNYVNQLERYYNSADHTKDVPAPVPTKTGARLPYVLDRPQDTNRGCWSCAFSLLLKSRGVDLDQTIIRRYRPELSVEEAGVIGDDMALTVNTDSVNSVSDYFSLVAKLCPNTVMKEISRINGNDNDVLNFVYDSLSKNAPVAFSNGSHWRTILSYNPTTGLCDIADSIEPLRKTVDLRAELGKNLNLQFVSLQDMVKTKDITAGANGKLICNLPEVMPENGGAYKTDVPFSPENTGFVVLEGKMKTYYPEMERDFTVSYTEQKNNVEGIILRGQNRRNAAAINPQELHYILDYDQAKHNAETEAENVAKSHAKIQRLAADIFTQISQVLKENTTDAKERVLKDLNKKLKPGSDLNKLCMKTISENRGNNPFTEFVGMVSDSKSFDEAALKDGQFLLTSYRDYLHKKYVRETINREQVKGNAITEDQINQDALENMIDKDILKMIGVKTEPDKVVDKTLTSLVRNNPATDKKPLVKDNDNINMIK